MFRVILFSTLAHVRGNHTVEDNAWYLYCSVLFNNMFVIIFITAFALNVMRF